MCSDKLSWPHTVWQCKCPSLGVQKDQALVYYFNCYRTRSCQKTSMCSDKLSWPHAVWRCKCPWAALYSSLNHLHHYPFTHHKNKCVNFLPFYPCWKGQHIFEAQGYTRLIARMYLQTPLRLPEFSPLANETDLNRQKYAILQSH